MLERLLLNAHIVLITGEIYTSSRTSVAPSRQAGGWRRQLEKLRRTAAGPLCPCTGSAQNMTAG